MHPLSTNQQSVRNSRKNIPRGKITKQGCPSSLHCIGQTVPDMNAAARRAIAITPGAIAAADTIGDRSLMQRESLLAFRCERSSGNTPPYLSVRKYGDGSKYKYENERFLTFSDRVVGTYTIVHSFTMQNFRRVVSECSLAARLKPSCTHRNTLPVS